MNFNFHETNSRIFLRIPGSRPVDESQGSEGATEIGVICQRAASSGKKLIADFRGVEFISSATVGVLLLVNRNARESGVEFRVSRLSHDILQVFKITRLDQIIPIDDDDDTDLLGGPVPSPNSPNSDQDRADPLE